MPDFPVPQRQVPRLLHGLPVAELPHRQQDRPHQSRRRTGITGEEVFKEEVFKEEARHVGEIIKCFLASFAALRETCFLFFSENGRPIVFARSCVPDCAASTAGTASAPDGKTLTEAARPEA